MEKLREIQPKEAWELLKNKGIIKASAKRKLKPKTKEKLKRYFEKTKAKRKLKTQDVHLDKWTEPPSFAEQMSNYLKIDSFSGKKMAEALVRWSDGASSKIREAQHNNNITSPYYIVADWLENYIDNAPKWSGKPIYRGLHLTPQVIDTFDVGKTVDMKGIASWSSDELVANDFAHNNKKPNEEEVIFVCNNGTKKGASITQLAEWAEEAEVLVSNKANYKVLKKYQNGKRIYIEVEEEM